GAAYDTVIRAEFRKRIAYFLRRDQPDIFQSERYLLLIIRPQVRDMLFVCCAEQITLGPITGRMPQSLFEAGIERNRVEGHLNTSCGRELRPHAAHTLARRSRALRRFPLNDQHASSARRRSVLGN